MRMDYARSLAAFFVSAAWLAGAPALDLFPQQSTLRRHAGGGLGEANQIGDVDLPGLAVDAAALDKDRLPMRVRLSDSAAELGPLASA